jgi:uncharacterized protein YdcH (DUF465 family)
MPVNVWNKSEQLTVNRWIINAKSHTKKNNAKFAKISDAYPNVRNMVKNAGKANIDLLYRHAHNMQKQQSKQSKGGRKTRRNRRR